MSECKIVVPDAMMSAAMGAELPSLWSRNLVSTVIDKSLSWFIDEILHEKNVDFHRAILAREKKYFPDPADGLTTMRRVDFEYGVSFARNYIRNLFIEKEPEVPEEIKRMQRIHVTSVVSQAELDRLVEELLVEAYRRGQQSKEIK